jgi:hypothetical protein
MDWNKAGLSFAIGLVLLFVAIGIYHFVWTQ